MTTRLFQIGKTTEPHVAAGFDAYANRLRHYCRFEVVTLKPSTLKSASAAAEDESNRLLAKLKPGEFLIALDETGKQLTSPQFADAIQRRLTAGVSDFAFAIGGAWGHAPALRQRANLTLALSPMTFPHQLVRLIFIEQLYRAHTILRNEPYHH